MQRAAQCSSARPPLDDVAFPALDDELIEFVVSGEATCDLAGKDPKERRWLHTRAESLGLRTETLARGTLRVVRPDGWELPASPIETVRPARRGRRMHVADWSDTCDNCGKELQAHEAMYHWSGMGPLCEECIDRDPELAGLKWEDRASFWF